MAKNIAELTSQVQQLRDERQLLLKEVQEIIKSDFNGTTMNSNESRLNLYKKVWVELAILGAALILVTGICLAMICYKLCKCKEINKSD